ncbi:MAG: replication initiator [Actinomycetes bacterium]
MSVATVAQTTDQVARAAETVGLPAPDQETALVLDRASRGGYDRWSEQIRSTGYCSHPVRLSGQVTAIDRATGEARVHYDTGKEPDGVLLKACNNRRATVCPTCAETYRADTYQLIAAGLRGGKGVPETVGAHPRVFGTLTAGSFGPVHGRVERRGRTSPCRARRRRVSCPHGRPTWCTHRHTEDDPWLGRPLCAECYDYDAAVLFNCFAPELWRRFTIYLRRDLARLAGLSQKRMRQLVRVRFAKVAEGQKRGLVHFHAVLRLDAAADDPAEHLPPPPPFTADLLEEAFYSAAARVHVDTPALSPSEPGVRLRFGEQVDVRTVRTDAIERSGESGDLDETAVAAYLAKYVTKATATGGISDRTFTRDSIATLNPGHHYDRMALTAWRLGGRKALEEFRLRRWAHMLGFRGHVATRSRGYSTTLGRLRGARRDYRVKQKFGDQGPRDPWGRALDASDDPDDDESTVLLVADWRFTGRGHTTVGDAWLAETSAARAREHKEARNAERRNQTVNREEQ